MGCGSSQSATVIRSSKVAPMDDAPTDPPQVDPVAAKTKPGDATSASRTGSGSEARKKLFVQPSASAGTNKPPSPTPSRKSMKSLSSSRNHSASGLASSKKHSGSNRSLVSLRAEEKQKRDQVAVSGGSASSLTRKPDGGSGQDAGKTTIITVRADSKASTHTVDSGLGGNDHPSTASSTVKLPRHIDGEDDDDAQGERDENRPVTPELCIQGQGIKNNRKTGSARSRTNQRNREALEAPDKDTSIIQRPPSRGGMAFDIVSTPDTGNVRRAPSRLRQLRRTPSMDKNTMSSEQLKEKLEAAERRRQQYEKENVLSKVENQKRRSNQVHSALEEFASRQTKQAEGRILHNLDKKSENREAQLRALRERLQAKEEHARKVREAKQALAASNA